MPQVTRILPYDDLEAVVSHINAAEWDELNEIDGYSAADLASYLSKEGTRFVVCMADGQLAGMASARIEHKPYSPNPWLYIDEVDVAVNQRRKGAGSALMKALLSMAKEEGCTEVWLGTELDNKGATQFYPTLHPDEIENVIGYTFLIKDDEQGNIS